MGNKKIEIKLKGENPSMLKAISRYKHLQMENKIIYIKQNM